MNTNNMIVVPLILILFILPLEFSYSQNNLENVKEDKYYEPVDNKIIGIWPHNSRFKDIDKLNELREKWGFHYLLIADVYGTQIKKIAQEAGYDSIHIMKQLIPPNSLNKDNWYKENIIEFGRVWAYYIDEPKSRNYSFLKIADLLIYLSNNGYYPKGRIVVGELTEDKAKLFSRISDQLTYSGYGRIEDEGNDQIQTWTEWKNSFKDQFSMIWINALIDSNEYGNLFAAAKRLGFEGVWLYALEPLDGNEVSDKNYQKFCETAVEYGFLKKKKKK